MLSLCMDDLRILVGNRIPQNTGKPLPLILLTLSPNFLWYSRDIRKQRPTNITFLNAIIHLASCFAGDFVVNSERESNYDFNYKNLLWTGWQLWTKNMIPEYWSNCEWSSVMEETPTSCPYLACIHSDNGDTSHIRMWSGLPCPGPDTKSQFHHEAPQRKCYKHN